MNKKLLHKWWVFLLATFILPFVVYGVQSVTLAWDANTESDLAGYIVHYGNSSGSYTNAIDVGNVTLMSVSNLVEGATYYFVVTAYNTSGLESDPSNEVSYRIPSTNDAFLLPRSVQGFCILKVE